MCKHGRTHLQIFGIEKTRLKFFYLMISELTETTEHTKISGWILYDAECELCVALAQRFMRPLGRRGFRFAALQSPWVAERLQLPPQELLAEMRLLTPDGRMRGGADAV